MKRPRGVLPLIVISQFCCTSLWFAGNAVMEDLVKNFHLQASALGHLTSAVQLGFIAGTLLFALLSIADRFSPSRVFFLSALAGALFNFATVYEGNTMLSLLATRFMTGFFLAGIYPVGMKIAADYFEKGLGKSLGYLVGALVLGTAFPHLIRGFYMELPWKSVLMMTSVLAGLGGLLILLFVPDGPHKKQAQKVELARILTVFKNKAFRSAAFGYFGHMWELYAFWAFVPLMLTSYSSFYPTTEFNIPVSSFIIIGIGCFSCILGGYISQSVGAKKTATFALGISLACCLVSPVFFFWNAPYVFLGFLLLWGMAVVADSPLFSTLVAHNVQAESKGTALTIVNSIGFAVSILSIQLLNGLKDHMDIRYIFLFLAMGPILGLMALLYKEKVEPHTLEK